MIVIVGLDLDLKYLVPFMQYLTDELCLFLMFNENTSKYKNICGCLFDKCCINCIYGLKYRPIQTLDDEEQDVI